MAGDAGVALAPRRGLGCGPAAAQLRSRRIAGMMSASMAASPPASALPAALDCVGAWQRLLEELAREPTVEGQCQLICRELGQSLGFTRAMIATVHEDGRRLATRAAHDPTTTAPLVR